MQIETAISGGRRAWLASCVTAAFTALLGLVASLPASAATLERIGETGRIKLGYVADAPPFTSGSEAGTPEGYSVDLCQRIVEHVKTALRGSDLAVDWVPLTVGRLIPSVAQGDIDLLCTPISQTLTRRQDVAFSIPVFPGGVRAVLRKDAASALRDVLADSPANRPVWRGSPAATVLTHKSFAVVGGTTTEKWLADKLTSFHIDAKIVPVADHRTALQALLDRKVDAFFADRALVLGAMDQSAVENLTILPRLMTHEPLAFAMARDNDEFRLLVDRALSETFVSTEFDELYSTWSGELDDNTRAFFQWITLQE